MTRGKQTCKILKEIRRQIAEANDIEFVTSECRYKGDCFGTCPKCEAEVRYLEQQLRARSRTGKAVALAGISAGIMLMSGCNGTSSNQSNETLQGEPVTPIEQKDTVDSLAKEGERPPVENIVSVKKGEIDPNEVVIVGEIPDSTNKVSFVDTPATFPGGEQKLMEWISQHLTYPPTAIDEQIQGRVVIQFQVKVDGTIGNVKIIKGVHPDLDTEALRVVKSLPKFNSAMLNGKGVESLFTLPITFKLPID